jgi:membrane dipeptidase
MTTSRRQFIVSTAALLASGAPTIARRRFRLFAWSPTEYSERAIRLVRESLVIDMLSPFTLNFPLGDQWQAKPETFGADVVAKFRSSGINVFHPAVGIGGPDAFDQGMQFFAGWNSFLAGRDDILMRVDSPGDFARVKGSGKIAVILGLQNAEHFRRPGDVDLFYGYGQRVAQLTYNSRNLIGNGSTERRDEGLSDFGVAIVERMNAIGMAGDVSHSGDQTTLDACAVSKKPVLFTHSNARALNPGHPRCKTDEAIRAMAKSGGVMGITGVRNFVKGNEPTTIEDFLNHYDYVAKLVGVEHLGIGSDIDLDGYDDMPPEEYKRLKAGYKGSYAFRDKIDIEGIDHPKRVFDLTEGLIRRKYSDADIRGVLGGNFKRVLGEIWNVPEVPAPKSDRS